MVVANMMFDCDNNHGNGYDNVMIGARILMTFSFLCIKDICSFVYKYFSFL